MTYHIRFKNMDISIIILINKYLSSADYKNEEWYKSLDATDKEFINALDKAVSEGVEKGIKDYVKEKKGEKCQ